MFRYYNNDFGVLSRSGANYTAVCPECGKENLSLSPAKHMAKCFTAGCGFKAGEFRDEPRPEDEPYGIPVESERNKSRENMISEYSMEKVNPFTTYVTSDEQVPVLISDYGRKEITLKDKIAVLTADADESSAEGMRMVRKYLQDMGISLQTAIDSEIMAGTLSFSAKEMKHSNAENEYEQLPVIVFPYFVSERIVAIKARTVSMRGGKYEKAFHAEKAYKELPTPPFGINELQKQQYDKIIITEGEKDCLALREAGFWNAISVPNGAGDDIRKCLAPFMCLFDAASEIIICGDNDFRGRFLQMRLMYIFQGRSRLVEIDPTEGKDIADVLLNQGAEAVREKILSARSFSDSKTIRPNDIENDVLNALRGVSIESFSLGYGPLTDRHFRLTNRGGLVVVTGLPGDGKSDFLYDMAAHLINAQKKRFTFCSMEEPDVQEVFGDMIHRILDRADLTQLSDAQLLDEVRFLNDYMACFNIHKGDPSGPEIIRECDAQWNTFRPDFLIIDNYARLKRDIKESQNETDFVRDLLANLQDWGLLHKVWVFIVAHPRKVERLLDEDTVKASDISGSAHWHNLADFVISIRRISEPATGTDFKILDVLKVRNQRVCTPGRVHFHRRESGRHCEFER